MSDFVELRQIITVVLRWWWLLILSVVLAGAAGYWVSQQQAPVYRATTTLMVGQSMQAAQLDSGDIATSERLALTYANLVRRQPILQSVIEDLGLDETWRALKGRVYAEPVQGTQLLEIAVEAGSPKEASAIADTIAGKLILLSPTTLQSQEQDKNQHFMRQRLEDLQANIEAGQTRVKILESTLAMAHSSEDIQKLQGEIQAMYSLIISWEDNYARMLNFTKNEALPNYLAIVEPAQANPNPVRPRVLLNALLAGVVGLFLALGFISVREYLDDTLKSEDDLSHSLDLAALGAISRIKGRQYPDKQIAASQNPFSSVAEAYRMVRSNIQFMSVDQPIKTIMVTSAIPGEGKSTTAANLGVIMAQAGLSTVIVDTDLRRPVQHQIFQIPNLGGLTELLRSPGLEIGSHLRKTKVDNLQILTAGGLPPNPAELLGSQRMGQLLANLNELADIVIYDSSPVLLVTDAAILSSRVDGTVLVIEAGRTRRDMARKAIATLRQANAHLLGGVLNRVSGKKGHHYYHHSYFVPTDTSPAKTANA